MFGSPQEITKRDKPSSSSRPVPRCGGLWSEAQDLAMFVSRNSFGYDERNHDEVGRHRHGPVEVLKAGTSNVPTGQSETPPRDKHGNRTIGVADHIVRRDDVADVAADFIRAMSRDTYNDGRNSIHRPSVIGNPNEVPIGHKDQPFTTESANVTSCDNDDDVSDPYATDAFEGESSQSHSTPDSAAHQEGKSQEGGQGALNEGETSTLHVGRSSTYSGVVSQDIGSKGSTFAATAAGGATSQGARSRLGYNDNATAVLTETPKSVIFPPERNAAEAVTFTERVFGITNPQNHSEVKNMPPSSPLRGIMGADEGNCDDKQHMDHSRGPEARVLTIGSKPDAQKEETDNNGKKAAPRTPISERWRLVQTAFGLLPRRDHRTIHGDLATRAARQDVSWEFVNSTVDEVVASVAPIAPTAATAVTTTGIVAQATIATLATLVKPATITKPTITNPAAITDPTTIIIPATITKPTNVTAPAGITTRIIPTTLPTNSTPTIIPTPATITTPAAASSSPVPVAPAAFSVATHIASPATVDTATATTAAAKTRSTAASTAAVGEAIPVTFAETAATIADAAVDAVITTVVAEVSRKVSVEIPNHTEGDSRKILRETVTPGTEHQNVRPRTHVCDGVQYDVSMHRGGRSPVDDNVYSSSSGYERSVGQTKGNFEGGLPSAADAGEPAGLSADPWEEGTVCGGGMRGGGRAHGVEQHPARVFRLLWQRNRLEQLVE